MGERDFEYDLKGEIELDEAFFTTERPKDKKDELLKQGSGSERKAKVLVMVESTSVNKPKNGKKKKSIGRVKMLVIPDLKGETIFKNASKHLAADADLTMDASHAHILLGKYYKHKVSRMNTQKDVDENLPWVHVMISNAKSMLLDTYHGIKAEYLQDYLNEFCHKFNRRSLSDRIFDRLLDICAGYQNGFEHRIYNKKSALP